MTAPQRSPEEGPGQPRMVRLRPGQPTRIPGTGCELWWDGDQAVTVYRRGGFWDLSPLTRPGRVLAWQRLADRPHLGWWPIMPLTCRNTYRVGGARPGASTGEGAQASWAAFQMRSNESR